MTGPSRRILMAGTAAAAALAALGYRLRENDADAVFLPGEDSILGLIRREFGDKIGNEPDAMLFSRDLASGLQGETQEALAIFLFIAKTNVIRAMETGEGLIYLGPETLVESPCRNTLSSDWL